MNSKKKQKARLKQLDDHHNLIIRSNGFVHDYVRNRVDTNISYAEGLYKKLEMETEKKLADFRKYYFIVLTIGSITIGTLLIISLKILAR